MASAPVLSSSELYRKYRYGDPGRHNPGPPLVSDDHVATHGRLVESYKPIEKFHKGWYPIRKCSFPDHEPLPAAGLSNVSNEHFRNYHVVSDKHDPMLDISVNEKKSCGCRDPCCRPNSVCKCTAPKLFSEDPRHLYKNCNCQFDNTWGYPCSSSWDQALDLPVSPPKSKALCCDLLKEKDKHLYSPENHKDPKTCQLYDDGVPGDNSGYKEILQYEPKTLRKSCNCLPLHRSKSPPSAWRVTCTSMNTLPRSPCLRSQSRKYGKRDRSCGRGKPPPKCAGVTTRPHWSQHWNKSCPRQPRNAKGSCRPRSWSQDPSADVHPRGSTAQGSRRRSLSFNPSGMCRHHCIN